MSQIDSEQPPFDAHHTAAGIRTAMAQVQAANVRRRDLIATGRLDDSSAIVPLGPDSIPGYQVLREIHRGGQGIVYQAIQSSTGRKVALKIMKEGPFAGSGEHARFEREVRVLAQLDHPHIVAIHDSGSAAGCHYFVMNYIAGQPLDVYMAGASEKRQNVKTPTRQNESGGTVGLSVKSTLKLFLKICEAINAAHLRGIIHRDIKPSNIRVDENGEPHVLDFGLAKVAITPEHATAMTQTGQFVGSLPWASPEQAQGAASQIDMRTDVYSLGVLLYQMLTGKFPYEVADNMREVLNRIVNDAPVRPRTLRRDIDDDVETITLKCLRKDRDRRYQTAGELARDVRHYLAGDPIEAKRDSLGYVVRKLFRRHWVGFGIAVAFVLVLVLGFAYAMHHSYRADRALAEKEQQRQRAESVGGFLKELLTLADPAKAKGEKLTMRDALDKAAQRIDDGALHEQPLVEADIRTTIAKTYDSLGLHAQAEAQFRATDAIQTRALGTEHPDTLRTRHNLGETLAAKCDWLAAAELARPTMEAQSRILGPDHLDTIQSMILYGRVVWAKPGRFPEAELTLSSAIERLGRTRSQNDPVRALALDFLGEAYTFNSYPAKAEPLHREALRIKAQALGDERRETLDSMLLLATSVHNQGRVEEAATILQRALEVHVRVYGPEHPGTLKTRANLAMALYGMGRLTDAEAEQAYRELVAGHMRAVGPKNNNTIHVQRYLAGILINQGKHVEAEIVLREALAAARDAYGAEDSDTSIRLMCQLVKVLSILHKDPEAEKMARELLEFQRRQSPRPEPAELDDSSRALIAVLRRRGANDEALRVEQELIGSLVAFAHETGASAAHLNLAAIALLNPADDKLRDAAKALELSLQANQTSQMRDEQCLQTLARAYLLTGDAIRAGAAWEKAGGLLRDDKSRARMFNGAAWQMLTVMPDTVRDPAQALKFALRANELSGYMEPASLDTLALAYFRSGDTSKAIELQKKALNLVPQSSPDRRQYEAPLAEYEAALNKTNEKDGQP